MPASDTKTSAKKAEAKKQQPELPSTIELKGATITLQPSKRRTIRKIKVTLSGGLSINVAQEFLSAITPIFDKFDYIDFYLKDIQSLDLSVIQVLYHLNVHYASQEKHVTIDGDLHGDIRKIIVHAGFEELMFIPKLV